VGFLDKEIFRVKRPVLKSELKYLFFHFKGGFYGGEVLIRRLDLKGGWVNKL